MNYKIIQQVKEPVTKPDYSSLILEVPRGTKGDPIPQRCLLTAHRHTYTQTHAHINMHRHMHEDTHTDTRIDTHTGTYHAHIGTHTQAHSHIILFKDLGM